MFLWRHLHTVAKDLTLWHPEEDFLPTLLATWKNHVNFKEEEEEQVEEEEFLAREQRLPPQYLCKLKRVPSEVVSLVICFHPCLGCCTKPSFQSLPPPPPSPPPCGSPTFSHGWLSSWRVYRAGEGSRVGAASGGGDGDGVCACGFVSCKPVQTLAPLSLPKGPTGGFICPIASGGLSVGRGEGLLPQPQRNDKETILFICHHWCLFFSLPASPQHQNAASLSFFFFFPSGLISKAFVSSQMPRLEVWQNASAQR